MDIVIVWACTECGDIADTRIEANGHHHVMVKRSVNVQDLDSIRKEIARYPWFVALACIEEVGVEARGIAKVKNRI